MGEKTRRCYTPPFPPRPLQSAEARVFALVSEVFALDSRGWLHRQMVGVVRTLARLLYHSRAARKRISAGYTKAVSAAAMAGWVRGACAKGAC